MYYNNPDYIGVKALASHNLDWICKGALDFLDAAAQTPQQPFFLYCATTIPHGPEEADRSWNANPLVSAYGMLKKPLHVMPARNTIPKRLKQAGIAFTTKGNEANMLWLDDMFAAIIQKLKDNKQFENTVILYFNDHGQRAKGTVYQGGVHTEAFITHAGKPFPIGSSTDVMLSNIDFTPTLLDLAGVDLSKETFDGKSFLPLLNGKNQPIHDALYFELGFTRGILKDGWKYIALRYPDPILKMPLSERQSRLDVFNKSQIRRGLPVYTRDPQSPFSHVQLIPGGGDAEHDSITLYSGYYDADQLYNIHADPNEIKNLAKDPEYAAKLKELKKALADHLKTMPGTFPLQ
jgi:arylsulfatase A-like enzyme